MSVVLRPYQTKIIEEAREIMRSGCRSLLICSPTGSGKTALTAKMLGSAASRGMSAWFVVHRRELVSQSASAFFKADVQHGIVANGFVGDERQKIQIASVQTLINRMNRLEKPNLIIWDECHHMAAGSWVKIHKQFPKAFHIGLTATPQRLDGKGLRDWFKTIVHGPSVSWLIKNNFLSPYRLYAPTSVSMSGVHRHMGDYKKSETIKIIDKPTITGSAINEYRKYANDKRAVVFCVSIEHSKHVVYQFNEAGIPSLHIDGETPADERDNSLRLFREGHIKVISNVDLFGEGFDLPSMECVILLRPTNSLGLYLQQVGRALRPFPGKSEAIILDHVGNYERHGLPDDDREWTLDGRGDVARRKDNSGPSVKICEKCFAAQYPVDRCRFCGNPFEIKVREVDHVEGELGEIDLSALRVKRDIERRSARTFDDLVELGKSRGYKKPYAWAKHLTNARQAKKIGR